MLSVIPMVTTKNIATRYTKREMRREFKYFTIKNQLHTWKTITKKMRDQNKKIPQKTLQGIQ